MCDATSEPPDGLHSLGLRELQLELLALRGVLDEDANDGRPRAVSRDGVVAGDSVSHSRRIVGRRGCHLETEDGTSRVEHLVQHVLELRSDLPRNTLEHMAA